jgi:hypothetical protein
MRKTDQVCHAHGRASGLADVKLNFRGTENFSRRLMHRNNSAQPRGSIVQFAL